MRVLIAEDSESVRFALRLVVEYFGHEVVGQTDDGNRVLDLYRRIHPELVLMDVQMPGMDGLTCTALLSAIDPLAKVVIVTAGRTTEREAREAGATGFVEKPFDLREIGRLLASAAAA
jgi:two-component system, chemotaxis family, chemotaxis protein CheY